MLVCLRTLDILRIVFFLVVAVWRAAQLHILAHLAIVPVPMCPLVDLRANFERFPTPKSTYYVCPMPHSSRHQAQSIRCDVPRARRRPRVPDADEFCAATCPSRTDSTQTFCTRAASDSRRSAGQKTAADATSPSARRRCSASVRWCSVAPTRRRQTRWSPVARDWGGAAKWWNDRPWEVRWGRAARRALTWLSSSGSPDRACGAAPCAEAMCARWCIRCDELW